MSHTTRSYVILDNGGPPFLARIWEEGGNGQTVEVFNNEGDHEHPVPGKLVLKLENVSRVFIGADPPGLLYNDTGVDRELGNSILVHTHDDTYVYIGESVKEFKVRPGDVIQKYLSPVGNSAVPYPFAVGTQATYLMIEGKALAYPVRDGVDPYSDILYAGDSGAKALRMKTLVKRRFGPGKRL